MPPGNGRTLELAPAMDTRLRVLRRLAVAVVLLVAAAVVVSQFTELDRIAASILASGAIAAAVVGFAARQVLANAVAGILLAVTQPLRIGDRVVFEGESGVVEDVRLVYTYLRTPTDVRIVIPNERLAAGILRNESIIAGAVPVEASVWVGPDTDADAALAALGEGAAVAEIAPEGIRLTVVGPTAEPGERAGAEAEARLSALRALRQAGLHE